MVIVQKSRTRQLVVVPILGRDGVGWYRVSSCSYCIVSATTGWRFLWIGVMALHGFTFLLSVLKTITIFWQDDVWCVENGKYHQLLVLLCCIEHASSFYIVMGGYGNGTCRYYCDRKKNAELLENYIGFRKAC